MTYLRNNIWSLTLKSRLPGRYDKSKCGLSRYLYSHAECLSAPKDCGLEEDTEIPYERSPWDGL